MLASPRGARGVRRTRKLPQHRLAPDDDEVAFVRQRGGSPQQVFKRIAGHGGGGWPDVRPA
jgi:hypothetical protein